jgi:hypothetical protein
MKLLIVLAAAVTTIMQSQVMNDAQVLLTGNTGIHISAVRSNGIQYPTAGLSVGIFRRLDLKITAGSSSRSNYLSVHTEFAIQNKPNISVSVGGHTEKNSSGADGTLNISFPVNRFLTIYNGVDGKINRTQGTSSNPVWYFLGVSGFFNRHLEAFLESELAVSSASSNIFSGGLRVYF